MPDLKDCRFLVVDDTHVMRMLTAHALSSYGVNTIAVADDGQSAWEMIEQEAKNGSPFQFIISDWHLPHLQGIDLLKRCRASEVHKDVLFLFVTAETGPQCRDQAGAAKGDGILLKPFTKDALYKAIQEILQNRDGKSGMGKNTLDK